MSGYAVGYHDGVNDCQSDAPPSGLFGAALAQWWAGYDAGFAAGETMRGDR